MVCTGTPSSIAICTSTFTYQKYFPVFMLIMDMPACMFFPYGYLDLSLPQKHFHHGFDIFRRHIAWYGVGRRRYQSAFQKRVKQCAGDSFDFIRRFIRQIALRADAAPNGDSSLELLGIIIPVDFRLKGLYIFRPISYKSCHSVDAAKGNQ